MSGQSNTTFGVDGGEAGKTPAESTKQVDTEDPVSLLVGEGKKFKTVQDLAKGKIESDKFIENLTIENRALREVLGAEPKQKETPEPERKGEEGTATQKGNHPQTEPITTETVLSLMARRDAEKLMVENSAMFNQTITGVFGDKATEVVLKHLADLGLDQKTFNQMVATSPKSALALVGVKPNAQANATAKSGAGEGINTTALFANGGGSVKNFKYFEALRRELKNDYYRPEVQKDLMESRKTLGSDFWK